MHHTHKTKHPVETHRDRGVGILDEAKERASDMADDAKTQGKKLFQQAKKHGDELLDKAQDQGENAWKDVRTVIQKNPVKAVSYAFVAGAALYALFRRRESK